MGKILFGYDMKDGVIIINDRDSNLIKKLYILCSQGISLRECVEETNAQFNSVTAKKLLQNTTYMGTDIYPQIISKEIFVEANNMIKKREKPIGKRPRKIKEPSMNFIMKKCDKRYSNPFVMAQYKYNLIEEVCVT